jgi:hypothetical protein
MKSIVFVVLLLASGLTSAQEKGPPPPRNDFYPLHAGAKWTYSVPHTKGAFKDIEVVVERLEPVRRKQRAANLGEFLDSFHIKTISEDLPGDKTSNDRPLGVKMVLSEQLLVSEDGVFRMRSAGKDIEPPAKLLKAPGDPKLTWNVDSESETVKLKGTFTAETFDADLDQKRPVIKVSCRNFQIGNRTMDVDYWFAKDIGIVKQRVSLSVSLGSIELMTHLKEYRPDEKTVIRMPARVELDARLQPVGAGAPPQLPVPEKK